MLGRSPDPSPPQVTTTSATSPAPCPAPRPSAARRTRDAACSSGIPRPPLRSPAARGHPHGVGGRRPPGAQGSAGSLPAPSSSGRKVSGVGEGDGDGVLAALQPPLSPFPPRDRHLLPAGEAGAACGRARPPPCQGEGDGHHPAVPAGARLQAPAWQPLHLWSPRDGENGLSEPHPARLQGVLQPGVLAAAEEWDGPLWGAGVLILGMLAEQIGREMEGSTAPLHRWLRGGGSRLRPV